MRLPFWMVDGQHWIWYRQVRECRHYYDACYVHYLTLFRNWPFAKTFVWETQ